MNATLSLKENRDSGEKMDHDASFELRDEKEDRITTPRTSIAYTQELFQDKLPPVAVPNVTNAPDSLEFLCVSSDVLSRSNSSVDNNPDQRDKTPATPMFKKKNRLKKFTAVDSELNSFDIDSDGTPMLLSQTSPRSDQAESADQASTGTGGGSIKGIINAHSIDRKSSSAARNRRSTRRSHSGKSFAFDEQPTMRGLPRSSSFSSSLSVSTATSKKKPSPGCKARTTQRPVKLTKGLRTPTSLTSAASSIFQELENNQMSPETSRSPPKSTRAQQLKSKISKASETLFGDNGVPDRYGKGESTVIPRTLLPHSVTYDTRAKQWVGTIATTQDKHGPKHCRVFFYDTEEEAKSSTLSNTPPVMCTSDRCMNCNGKFAVFKRSYNCTNCGACVCQSCSDASWPAKMVPPLYNKTIYSSVKVCISCDRLNKALKKALLAGDFGQVIAIHVTGNVNLRRPFVDPKNTMYPIHCSVISGNVELTRWLIEQHRTPIYSSKGDGKTAKVSPLLTGKGQSLVYIAALNRNAEMLRYLVVERGISLKSIKCVTTALAALSSVLRHVPNENSLQNSNPDEDGYIPHISSETSCASIATTGSTLSANNVRGNFDVIESAVEMNTKDDISSQQLETQVEENDTEECIICFDKKIDCVMVPCGHQICCFNCASATTCCPICKANCTVIKIYRK
uniref:RING-type domain-containing protein n=1 Tax=Corethron hystrix TaxID=216773 RepID=A0A7S1BQP3_9STRA|mmetsp:Transcript_35838/g.83516  ORF Transcript_35838/g.83516 Transcript_35838/m.83516 type:complete len:681 (+) Transcript_35838:205-2247(+)